MFGRSSTRTTVREYHVTRKFGRPGTPNPIKSAEDRDLEALKRRREERLSQEDDDEGVTPVEFYSDITKPTDLVSMELERSPAMRVMWDRISRIKHEERHALRQLGSQTLELHANIDPRLAKRVDELEKMCGEIATTLRIAKWIIGFVIAATLGSVVVVATKIFSWGYGSGEIENRLKHLEKDNERLNDRINQRQWRQMSPQPQDTKGTQ